MFLGDYFQNIQSTYKKFFFSGISFNSNKIKKKLKWKPEIKFNDGLKKI